MRTRQTAEYYAATIPFLPRPRSPLRRLIEDAVAAQDAARNHAPREWTDADLEHQDTLDDAALNAREALLRHFHAELGVDKELARKIGDIL